MELSKDDLMNGLFGNTKAQPNHANSKKDDLIKTLLGGGGNEGEIAIDLIDSLKAFEHPFEKSLYIGIDELAESIKASGLWQPIIVRPTVGGRYEILAGHRRTEAARRAGLTYIKAIVNECDDDTAKLIVTETNTHQREEIFPSEKAKAYRIQLEALKNQGKRNDLIRAIEDGNNLSPNRAEVKKVQARDIVAELNSISKTEISRYLRLNELIKPLLDLVDNKDIPISAAVELSYLRINEQQALYELLKEQSEIKISIALAEELREASKDIELSALIIESIVEPPIEDTIKDFKEKAPKPVYKKAFKSVEQYMRKLEPMRAEKLVLADEKVLESKIKEVIEEYLDSL